MMSYLTNWKFVAAVAIVAALSYKVIQMNVGGVGRFFSA